MSHSRGVLGTPFGGVGPRGPATHQPPVAQFGMGAPAAQEIQRELNFRYSTRTPSRNNKDDLIRKSKQAQDRCTAAIDKIDRDIEEFGTCIAHANEQKEFVKARLERERRLVETLSGDELIAEVAAFIDAPSHA